MELSPVETDDDHEQWRAVRIALMPYERCPSVAELRADDSPDRLLLLAREGGVVVGSGQAAPSQSRGAGSIAPRVLPEHRRRGVGSALLRRLVEHVEGLGVDTVRAKVDDDADLPFAHRFGFVEVDREVEQTYVLDTPPSLPPLAKGVQVVTAQDRTGLWEGSFDRFGREVLADIAVTTPLDISAEQWSTSWLADPMFLAVHEDEVVGCAGLLLDPDEPRRAEHALTAVRRDWRGRGLAVHLKLRTLQWAADRGLAEVYTWTQTGNAAMRALNERLGYATTRTSTSLARSLPL